MEGRTLRALTSSIYLNKKSVLHLTKIILTSISAALKTLELSTLIIVAYYIERRNVQDDAGRNKAFESKREKRGSMMILLYYYVACVCARVFINSDTTFNMPTSYQ